MDAFDWGRLFIELIPIAILIVGGFWGVKMQVKIIQVRIDQLEVAQQKHNRLIERMVVVEQACKSAHKRLDEVTNYREEKN